MIDGRVRVDEDDVSIELFLRAGVNRMDDSVLAVQAEGAAGVDVAGNLTAKAAADFGDGIRGLDD